VSTDGQDPNFEELLTYLKRSRGFDFTGYKRTSLSRRIRKRMQAVNIERFSDYTDYLEVHPDEFAHLFNTILINVTDFFRDPPVWDYLATEIVPRVVAAKKNGDSIRIWSAGCASGQEAYTLAIAMAVGVDVFRERVKIYGTDIDLDALNQARQAVYAAREIEGIKPELLAKYFEKSADRYSFRKELRRSVIFGRHDLFQDAPISRLDLLICRNTLMYFNAESQGRILDRFHFAVAEGGYLLLGKGEMLLARNDSFVPVDLKRRVFTKVATNGNRRNLWIAQRNDGPAPASPLINHVRVREAAFDASPIPQVVVDPQGVLTLANLPARTQFSLSVRDFGEPLHELDLAVRPVELKPLIDTAFAENRSVQLKDVEWQRGNGDVNYLDVQVLPLRDTGNGLLGVSVSYVNVTNTRMLQEDLQRANQELESAYEELQSSNEELETTNEELQSTVEELETTNEELQSTNEELETMNEELHSANEELQTINEELRQRSDELNQVNTFLQSILGSFRGGVVVVDRDLLVLVWNHKTEDLWGLRAEEVQGKNFLNLDIGLPVHELKQPIRTCLAGDKPPADLGVDAVNRRGKPIHCRVNCAPLIGAGGETRGVILLMEETDGADSSPPP
jgi:two-component system CheB/CheR fusion protein